MMISEIERLAKAGVVVDLKDLMNRGLVQSDFMVMPPEPNTFPTLDAAFWDRWKRNMRATRPDEYGFGLIGFQFGAFETNDTVHCCVCDGTKFAVIEDQKALYPSDSLMAAIHLWEKTK